MLSSITPLPEPKRSLEIVTHFNAYVADIRIILLCYYTSRSAVAGYRT